jgi:hypothetical protein
MFLAHCEMYGGREVQRSVCGRDTSQRPRTARGVGRWLDTAGIASSVRRELESALQGKVVFPEDRGYNTTRAVFNGMIDRHPLVVIKPVGPSDVVACIAFARRHEQPLTVRGVIAWQGTRFVTRQ